LKQSQNTLQRYPRLAKLFLIEKAPRVFEVEEEELHFLLKTEWKWFSIALPI